MFPSSRAAVDAACEPAIYQQVTTERLPVDDGLYATPSDDEDVAEVLSSPMPHAAGLQHRKLKRVPTLLRCAWFLLGLVAVDESGHGSTFLGSLWS